MDITKKAQIKLKELKKENHFIRIGIKSGGCSGFEYVINAQSVCNKKSDIEVQYEYITVYIDRKSHTYLDKVVLDYKKSLMYSGFEFINPNAKSKCGCGQSFTV